MSIVDCLNYRLSIVAVRLAGCSRTEAGRWVGETVVVAVFDRLAIIGALFLSELPVCPSVRLSDCLDICLNGTGNFESCKEIVIIWLEAPQLQPPRPSRRVGGSLFFLLLLLLQSF